MDMSRTDFEHIVDFVYSKQTIIVQAHCELGIPIEDLVCAAVRQATRPIRNPSQQELSLEAKQ
jgi:hypothetical protein